MTPVQLLGAHHYTEVDQAFWERNLHDWVPERVFDAHVHVVNAALQIETITEEMKRSYWVMELDGVQSADQAQAAYRTVYPGREVSCLAFGMPMLGFEIEGGNEYVRSEAIARGWKSLAVVRPTWCAAQVATLLDQPGVIGVKPYYSLIGYDREGRDRYIEASTFDFMPHHQLEVLDHRSAWLTLHVPRAGRLGDPANLREVREIRRRYPRIRLVIAHLGRCYTLPHAQEGLLPLADDAGILFDTSAVVNPEVQELAVRALGPRRLLYGTDNPIFYLRGRRQFSGRSYVNRTSLPYHFNRERESPEVEATYTLLMYEDLYGLRQACDQVGLGPGDVERIMWRNAVELMEGANQP